MTGVQTCALPILALGEEVDALRKSTTTASRYNDVISITERRLAQQTSATGRVTQLERLIALSRGRANAEIGDLQEAAQKASPLAGLAAGLRDQIFGIRLGQTSNPIAQLSQIGLRLTEEQRAFRAGGPNQATAAQNISQLVAAQLERAASTYGLGSTEFQSVQKRSIAALQEIEAAAHAAESVQLDTLAAIEKVQLTLADTLERLGGPLIAAQEAARDQLAAGLEAALKPLGLSLDDVLGDPLVSQVAIQTKILEQITGVNTAISAFLDAAKGRDTEDAPEQKFARGVDAIFTRPTRALFGESGPERVTITPLTGPRRSTERPIQISVAKGAVVIQMPESVRSLPQAEALGRASGDAAAEAFVRRVVQKMRAFG